MKSTKLEQAEELSDKETVVSSMSNSQGNLSLLEMTKKNTKVAKSSRISCKFRIKYKEASSPCIP